MNVYEYSIAVFYGMILAKALVELLRLRKSEKELKQSWSDLFDKYIALKIKKHNEESEDEKL